MADSGLAVSRRGFLGWTATGAAGLLVPTVVRPKPKVFDMGRGPRRAWGPTARFYGAGGVLLGEVPVMIKPGGGCTINGESIYRMSGDRYGPATYIECVGMIIDDGGVDREIGRTPAGITLRSGDTLTAIWPAFRIY